VRRGMGRYAEVILNAIVDFYRIDESIADKQFKGTLVSEILEEPLLAAPLE
jgi:hypothetical protein